MTKLSDESEVQDADWANPTAAGTIAMHPMYLVWMGKKRKATLQKMWCASWDDFGVFLSDVQKSIGRRKTSTHFLRRKSKKEAWGPANICWFESRQYVDKKEYEKERKVAAQKQYSERPDITRARRLKTAYGLTVEDYENMVLSQGGGCKICGRPPSSGARQQLVVDHNHETGKVRGLLCYRCNSMIGSTQEHALLLKKAIEYVTKDGGITPALVDEPATVRFSSVSPAENHEEKDSNARKGFSTENLH